MRGLRPSCLRLPPTPVPDAAQKAIAAAYQLNCAAALSPTDANSGGICIARTRLRSCGFQRQTDAARRVHRAGKAADQTAPPHVLHEYGHSIDGFRREHGRGRRFGKVAGQIQAPDGNHDIDVTTSSQDTWKLENGTWLQTQSKDVSALVKIDGKVVEDKAAKSVIRRFAFIAAGVLSLAAPLAVRADERPISQMRWRAIGPALPEGRATAVVGSNAHALLYYAGTADGGVWKSVDGGTAWQNVSDFIHLGSVGTIAVNAADDADVWVGAGETNPRNDVVPESGLYHSTNGGRSWQTVPFPSAPGISKILLDPSDPKHILVAVLGDVFAPSASAACTYRSTAAQRSARRCTSPSSPVRATWRWIRRIPTSSTPACGTCCAVLGP